MILPDRFLCPQTRRLPPHFDLDFTTVMEVVPGRVPDGSEMASSMWSSIAWLILFTETMNRVLDHSTT
jgi:hypothetical protein